MPAEIGLLTSLEVLSLIDNQLTSVPAAIRDLRAAGCRVYLDDDEGDVGDPLAEAVALHCRERWREDEQAGGLGRGDDGKRPEWWSSSWKTLALRTQCRLSLGSSRR